MTKGGRAGGRAAVAIVSVKCSPVSSSLCLSVEDVDWKIGDSDRCSDA